MTTEQLRQKDKDLIWHPFAPLITPFEYIPLESAKGMYLHTTDGKKIIDTVSSWWVNIHGHADETLAKALYDQALTMEHAIFAGFTHKPAIKLSENLMKLLPDSFSKIFFSDNGSSAIEVALKMAFQYWYNRDEKQRTKVVAINGAYHGDTFGAMSVGERGGFTAPFFPFLFDVDFIDFPDADNQAEVLSTFETLVSDDKCSTFIFEPLVQGSGGMRMYSAELLDQLIAIAQKYGVICIADEVMTGFGRTGKPLATDYCIHKPDLICLSKGITGGTMALGITACNEKIEEAFQSDSYAKALLHGHSYTGNPLACAVANASFEIFMSDTCQNNIARIQAKHEAFAKTLEKQSQIEKVRVQGTIVAFDLKGFGETGYESTARQKIYPYFLERGILIRPLGNVIYLLPPYIITDEELDFVYKEILTFLEQL
ncbi:MULTISPECIES: adenosylmethionine--8-amino-7-oxononanoate transaminase [Reichenbachiella]|uniref:adenosylmethionine--8-amino-7-oxononanoate transaminase n=1 Tax=Reichenbachiella TaxID=156993 RepID=UPI000E6BCF41|nr:MULTISPECIES: adenosylmethionine--8-amino-7-oxononanoate transaminase [Reichenbachiella]MBU2914840.1 adenosylmethionine--8-amino-7-oxononanoate transaminase [Reichenbachiella agariperforans]RJE75216.1 adenosylmethionine--8-amino-7-oxononanoate transaminase [Reichenbachiella sp. MSK19-1]